MSRTRGQTSLPWRRTRELAALVFVAAVALAAAASPAGAFSVPVESNSGAVPTGFRLAPREAARIASATAGVRGEAARGPFDKTAVHYDPGTRKWSVEFQRNGISDAAVTVDDRSGRVTSVITGIKAASPLASGERGPPARRMHLILVIAGVLFLIPFVDPRRLLRLRHLDLLVLLGIGVVHFFFARGQLETAMPLLYPVLAYLLVRMLFVIFRPNDESEDDPLVPLLPLKALAVATAAVVIGRIAVNVFGDFGVMEGGYDSVWGADTITGGWELYARSGFPLNVYGPITYLAYVPFEAIFPLNSGWSNDALRAAHAAAITWDLATIAGLFLLGRKLRRGRDGLVLALALVFAYSTYPWTVAVMGVSTNDGLVPALVVWALVAAASVPGRALLLGLATGAKFFPLPFLPAFARGPDEGFSVRTILTYAAVVLAVAGGAIVAYLPDPGGLGQFVDLTLRSQLDRVSVLSIWGLHPSLDWLQTILRIGVTLLGIVLFFVPRERSIRTLAAAAAALIVAQEITLDHWYYLYASWFAPFVLIALFARSRPAPVTLPPAS